MLGSWGSGDSDLVNDTKIAKNRHYENLGGSRPVFVTMV